MDLKVEELFEAIENNDFKKTKKIVETGIDINTQDKRGKTALHIAVRYNNFDITEYLLKMEANPNIYDYSMPYKDELKDSSLTIASFYCNYKMIKLLIDYGADVNACHSGYDTVLQHLSMLGKLKAIKLLVKKGANINACDPDGETALMYATFCRKNPDKIIKLLVSLGADIEARNKNEMTALMLACKNSNHKAAITLLELGADVNAVGFFTASEMEEAIEFEDKGTGLFYKRLALLKKRYGSWKKGICKGITPFMLAMAQGGNIAYQLIDYGADITAKDEFGFTGFDEAIANKNFNITEVLKEIKLNNQLRQDTNKI